jgi:hypothetical protein
VYALFLFPISTHLLSGVANADIVSISFAASIPFIILAFNQDVIVKWLKDLVKMIWSYRPQWDQDKSIMTRLKGSALDLWGHAPQWLKRTRTWNILGGAAAFAVTMPLIWTSQLALTAKIAITLTIVIIAAIVFFLGFAWRSIYAAIRTRYRSSHSDASSSSSSGGGMADA